MPGGGHPSPALPLPQEGLGSQFLTLSARGLQGLLRGMLAGALCCGHLHGRCVLLRGTPAPRCSLLRWPCHSPRPGPGAAQMGLGSGLVQPHRGEHRDGTGALPAGLAQLREVQHIDGTGKPSSQRCWSSKDCHGHGDGGLCSSTTTARWCHGAPAAPLAVTLTHADSSKPGCGNLGCATEESHGQEGRGGLLPHQDAVEGTWSGDRGPAGRAGRAARRRAPCSSGCCLERLGRPCQA